MLWRIRDLVEGGGELLKAEIDLAARRVRRAFLTSLFLALGGVVAILGLLTLLAGAAIAMARAMGWIDSLSVLGGGLLLIGLIVALVSMSRLASHKPIEYEKSPRLRAEESREQMSDAVNPHVSKEETHGLPEPKDSLDFSDINELKSAASDFMAKNPMAVASGAFLVLSVIGPFRALRFVTRGLAVAGLVTTVLDAMASDRAEKDTRPVSTPPDEGPIVQSGSSRISSY